MSEKIELKINPEYEALLPKMTAEDYEAMKKSIQEEGQHYPIAYNGVGEILDGHNRFKICRELGIEPKLEAEPRVFADKLDEKQFVLETNLLRRHLETWQRITLAKPLLAIYSEKAERRRLTTLKQGDEIPIGKKLPNGEPEGKAIEQFAKVVHSNPETVRQALYIDEHAPPEKIAELDSGEKSISKVYKEIHPVTPTTYQNVPFDFARFGQCKVCHLSTGQLDKDGVCPHCKPEASPQPLAKTAEPATAPTETLPAPTTPPIESKPEEVKPPEPKATPEETLVCPRCGAEIPLVEWQKGTVKE